jgi:putative ABC transport system permease protein
LISLLVVANLKHRPVRTAVSALAISVQVTMLLTLVGISQGTVDDALQRARGVGADVIIRPPNSALFSFSTSFPESIQKVALKPYDVASVMGTLIYPIGGVDTMTGIDLPRFSAMSGGFRYLQGGPLRNPGDMLIDEKYATANHLRAGDRHELINRMWKIAGVVEPGKMSRIFVDLGALQTLTANMGRLSCVYVKIAKPVSIPGVIAELRKTLPDYPIYTMDDLLSQMSVANVEMLRRSSDVVIGIGTFVGFLVVFLSLYTAVVERTREIGTLKALGASPGLILNILLQESVLLALVGSALGIAMTYGLRCIIETLDPAMIQSDVPLWWPIATGIAVVGAFCGAAYPGLMAARQDVVEALAYE